MILVNCLTVLLLGEIRYWSLLGVKGLRSIAREKSKEACLKINNIQGKITQF